MDRQAQTVNATDKGPAEAPTDAIVRNVGELSHDVLILVELQTRLAGEDFRAAWGRSVRSTILGGLAASLAIGGLPMLLFGIAEFAIDFTSYPRPLIYLAVATIALLLSSVLAVGSVRGIIRSCAVFDRSKQELIRNLHWLKTIWRKPTVKATEKRRS